MSFLLLGLPCPAATGAGAGIRFGSLLAHATALRGQQCRYGLSGFAWVSHRIETNKIVFRFGEDKHDSRHITTARNLALDHFSGRRRVRPADHQAGRHDPVRRRGSKRRRGELCAIHTCFQLCGGLFLCRRRCRAVDATTLGSWPGSLARRSHGVHVCGFRRSCVFRWCL